MSINNLEVIERRTIGGLDCVLVKRVNLPEGPEFEELEPCWAALQNGKAILLGDEAAVLRYDSHLRLQRQLSRRHAQEAPKTQP